MDFSEYQQQMLETDENKRKHGAISVWGLVSEVGSIINTFKQRALFGKHNGFKDNLSEELGDTLWYLANVASREGLSLDEIAKQNLAKARMIYDEGSDNGFDKGYPEDERFPRKFDIVFSERKLDRHVQVKLRINGVFVGDALTDNAYDADGYRFHDVFHLGYVAALGWSPVFRSLLKIKRKSVPEVDEVEDGARAAIVEEAISIFIFNRAKTRHLFESRNAIDFSLLKSVRGMVGDLEVSVCTAKQWRHAIHQGYEAFRQLNEHRGGTVSVDMDAQRLTFQPPKAP